MKWFVVILMIIGLFIMLGYAAGILGTGRYVSNFERDEYDPENSFIKPAIVQDDLAIYVIGDGEPIFVFPYPHAGTEEPMAQSDFAEIFTTLGRKVITFDVPGAYASRRVPRVDMAEMLECALEALDASGIQGKIDVAGHSMGGLAALAFALEYPQRVDQLLLINTLSGFDASLKWGLPGSAFSWDQKEYWQLMYWGIRLKNGRGNLALHKRLMHLFQQASYINQSFVHPLRIDEGDQYIPTPVRSLWTNAVWNINYADKLNLLSVPTLITVGRYDPQTPLACAVELAEGILNNRLEIFENSGHYPFREEKEKFLVVVENFLEEYELE